MSWKNNKWRKEPQKNKRSRIPQHYNYLFCAQSMILWAWKIQITFVLCFTHSLASLNDLSFYWRLWMFSHQAFLSIASSRPWHRSWRLFRYVFKFFLHLERDLGVIDLDLSGCRMSVIKWYSAERAEREEKNLNSFLLTSLASRRVHQSQLRFGVERRERAGMEETLKGQQLRTLLCVAE